MARIPLQSLRIRLVFELLFEYCPLMAAVATLAPARTGTAHLLRQLHALLDQADTSDVVGASAAGDALREVDRLLARVHAVRLALLAEADRCDVAAQSGASGTPAWLAATTRTDGATASRDVRLASALDTTLPATRQALTAGDLSTDHAHVIATATTALPDGLRPEQRTAIEASLVTAARHLDPAALRKHARRALTAAEATQAQVDAHEDQVLRTEEDTAYSKTRLTWHHHDDGTTTGHFTLPTLAASILVKTIQHIASPRRFAHQAARAARADASTSTSSPAPSRAAVREATWEAFREADGDWAHRYGTAFLELLEHLPTDTLTGKVAATVVVTIDHDRLKNQLGAAHLDTGHHLSASQARRLACNAGILPAVLGTASVPLDLGRQHRFFTEPQRLALATTYDTCAAHGCDRPYAWSELHHQDPWATGGTTDLALAVPLCGHHHRRIHDPHYTHHITTTPGGRKTVTYTRRT
jgi:hypothetical protein